MAVDEKLPSAETISGKGILHRGPQMIATVNYTIHISPTNGQAIIVEFEPRPHAKDGDLLHLTLEDGRVLNCQVLDHSPYGAVVGDGPIFEQRGHIRS